MNRRHGDRIHRLGRREEAAIPGVGGNESNHRLLKVS